MSQHSIRNEAGVDLVPCVINSIVKTPLWTDNPDKMAQFSITDDPAAAVPVEDVAQTMLELVRDGKYPGGTVFKIDTNAREVVKYQGKILPPPEGKKAEDMLKVRERIVEPVRELLRRERGVARVT